MKRLANISVMLLLLGLTITAAAQSRTENSLLWRISGNGLGKASYLFGTMHVYDKKAFNFKDSLYYFLEHSEGFALEFNPDSANTIMQEYLDGIAQSRDEDKAPPEISPADLKSLQEKMDAGKKKGGGDDEKDMLSYFTERLIANDKKQKNSMSTFMDAYLYKMAEQEDKKMYGLEPVSIEIDAGLALSNGLKVKRIVNLLHKWDPNDESPIADYYYHEDIDSMNYFYNLYFTEESIDNFLYKRNAVMVNKMDSLMKLQSMFMAIGAGHLGGAKGVIALLRRQGFHLDPVFSSQKIFASDYKINKKDRPVYTVHDEQFGLEYELPGKPSTTETDAGRSVVSYYDLGAGLVYMTVCDKISSSDSKQSQDEIAIGKLDEMVTRVGGQKLSSKVFTVQGLKGMEAVCLGTGGNYSRFYELVSTNVYYLFSLTAQKKDNLFSPDAEKYIASFKKVPIPAPTWATFESPEDGFKISFPGKPKVEPVKFKEPGGMIGLTYSFFDASSGINCIVIPNKIMTGDGDPNDSRYLGNYAKRLIENPGLGRVSITDTIVEGLAGKDFSIPLLENKLKGFIVKRGNVVYLVQVGYEPGVSEDLVKKFLSSFSFVDFRKPNWALHASPVSDFTTWAPGDFVIERFDSSESAYGTLIRTFSSIDSFSATAYTVTSEKINQYFWAVNEDSIYSSWDATRHAIFDSIVSRSNIKNGNRTGRESIFFNKIDSLTKRSRQIVNGTTMYTLSVLTPKSQIGKLDCDIFFKNFRLSNEISPDPILNNSPDKIFSDLRSTDSSTCEKARNALITVRFESQHLPMLIEKALLEYPAAANDRGETINSQLFRMAGDFYPKAPASLQEQIREEIDKNYLEPSKTSEEIRFSELGLLARDTSQESYFLIKKKLADRLPSKEDDYELFSPLENSLKPSRLLYPDILRYISDTSMGMGIASLTRKMIDSGMISSTDVIAYKQDVLKLARRQLRFELSQKGDQYVDYRIDDLLELMGQLRQIETDNVLNDFLKAKTILTKKYAALALLRNGKPVPPAVLRKIADDNMERANLYEELQEIKKDQLFPNEFRSQQEMAKAYIYRSLMEDDEDESISDVQLVYIKQMESDYRGEKKRFFLFRVNYPAAEDTTGGSETSPRASYLGIAGPFDLDTTKFAVAPEKNISGVYFDEEFDGGMLNEFFKKFTDATLK